MKKYILIAGVNGAGNLFWEISKKRKKENTVLNSIMWGLILRKQQKNELHFGCGKADMV